jgi:phosphate acetyltransferase
LLDLLSHRVRRVGVFRPVTRSLDAADPVVDLLLSHPAVDQLYDSTIGVSYHALHADFDAAMSRIVDTYGGLSARYEALVVVGSDYTDVMTGDEWFSNATIAANLGLRWCWWCTAEAGPRS